MLRIDKRNSRGGALAAVIVLLLLAGVGVGIFFAVRGKAVNRGLAAAGNVPQTAVLVGAIEEPVPALTKGVEYMKAAAEKDKNIKEQWESFQKELKEKTGIDANDPASASAAGFDFKQPITFAVLQVDPASFSANILVSVGVSDGNKVLATLKKGEPNAKEDAGEPPVTLLGADMGVCIKDNRLYALCATNAKNRATIASSLRDVFKQREGAPLAAQEDFKTALSTLPPSGECTLFVSLNNIVRALPMLKPSPMVSDYQSLALSLAEGRVASYLAMRKDSAVLTDLEPGGSCQDFLGKMDAPIGALTFSIKDPEKLVRVVGAAADPQEMAGMDPQLKETFGMDLGEIGKLFQDTAGGVAFYPPAKREEYTPFDFVFFMKTNDRAKVEELLKKAHAKMESQKVETFAANTLYEERDENVGLVGDYVVFSNRIELLRTLAQEKGGGWKPRAGKRDLLDLEIPLGDAVRKLSNKSTDSVEKSIEDAIAPDASIFVQASKQPAGIFFDAEVKGVKSPTALPALIDELERSRKASAATPKPEGTAPLKTEGTPAHATPPSHEAHPPKKKMEKH